MGKCVQGYQTTLPMSRRRASFLPVEQEDESGRGLLHRRMRTIVDADKRDAMVELRAKCICTLGKMMATH